MKKLLTFLLLATATLNYGQITFENKYSTGSVIQNYIRLVKLSSSGYKYVMNDTNTITLYNLNHTLFKTITIPISGFAAFFPYPKVQVYYVSEELFNTNPANIEYLVSYSDPSYVGHIRVYDELGNMLFSKDSTVIQLTDTYGNENFISYTPSGIKMIISQADNSGGSKGYASVYSLPGTLPCHDCVNGTTTGLVTTNDGNVQEGKISNYPNPSNGQTTVEYNLPQGVTTADLVFYNITGQEIKRFKVTNAFRDILISTADLEAGTYYYQLQTATGFNAGKKMIVIK